MQVRDKAADKIQVQQRRDFAVTRWHRCEFILPCEISAGSCMMAGKLRSVLELHTYELEIQYINSKYPRAIPILVIGILSTDGQQIDTKKETQDIYHRRDSHAAN